jgi:hypothetical protein
MACGHQGVTDDRPRGGLPGLAERLSGGREAFCGYGAPHWEGQVHPLALGQLIAADSRFDRQLRQVCVYRGQLDANRDLEGYAANARQVVTWRQSPLVDVTMCTLRYPRGWPDSHLAGEKPQEKGIDVVLAIDFVTMAVTDSLR